MLTKGNEKTCEKDQIKKDFLPLLKKLEDGQLVGDAVSGFQNKIYTLRAPSPDQNQGKSGVSG